MAVTRTLQQEVREESGAPLVGEVGGVRAEVKGTDGGGLAFLRNPVVIFILNVITQVLMFL